MEKPPEKSVGRQSWKFHFYLSQLASSFFFFFLLPTVSMKRWQVKENVKLMLMERQHRNRELCCSVFSSKKTNLYHRFPCHQKKKNYRGCSRYSSLRWALLFYCLLLGNHGCIMLEHFNFSLLSARVLMLIAFTHIPAWVFPEICSYIFYLIELSLKCHWWSPTSPQVSCSWMFTASLWLLTLLSTCSFILGLLLVSMTLCSFVLQLQ